MKKKIFILVLFLSSIQIICAQDKFINTITPDHFKLQFAGNYGVLAAGLGYLFCHDIIQTDLFYGFIPKFVGGTNINIIAQKNTFQLIKKQLPKNHLITFSAGFSVIYTITNNTFLFLPEQFPTNYYSSNAIRLAPNISFNLLNLINNFGVYFEIGTLDNYLWYYINSNYIDFKDILNLAFGLKIPLRNTD